MLEEWYYIDNEKVFERKKEKVSHGKKFKQILGIYNKISNERLYISILDYFLDHEQKRLLLSDFIYFFSKEYNIFFEIFLEASIKNIAYGVSFSKRLENDKKYLSKVVKYIRAIDIGIENIVVESKITIDNVGKETVQKTLKTVHNIYDSNGIVVDSIKFDLLQESTGTIRFLSFIQRVIDTIEKGGVFIVDELSSRLHPMLTKLIIDIFQSEDNKKAQLIFTTHDISLLNKEQFRRDEIVFIDKDETGISKLYSLSDLKIREDATFNKDYMQGKYGAIPVFNLNNLFNGD